MTSPSSEREAEHKAPRKKISATHEETLRAHLKSATWLIFGVTIATFGLHYFGWLNRFETTSLDFLLRLREPVKPKYVWLVAITDKDYADSELFKKTSPLNPVQLRKIIVAVADLKPRVIGIDVDTSDSQGVRPETKVPILWGQRVTETEDARDRKTIPVLGNEQPQPSPTELGISVMPADDDGAIRRYRRKIPVSNGEVDSLPWAVTKAFCRAIIADATTPSDLKARCQRLLDSESKKRYQHPLLLTFSERPHSEVHVLSASEVIHTAAGDGWKNNPMFHEGIVLIGGTFALSGDVSYLTPLGTRSGVDLFSDAIETELQGEPITSLNDFLMLIFEVIGGYLLTIWHFFTKKWTTALRVLARAFALPLLAVVLSFFAFSSLAYWANFIPVLAAVLIHESYEHFKRHRNLVGKVHELEDTKRSSRTRRTKVDPES